MSSWNCYESWLFWFWHWSCFWWWCSRGTHTHTRLHTSRNVHVLYTYELLCTVCKHAWSHFGEVWEVTHAQMFVLFWAILFWRPPCFVCQGMCVFGLFARWAASRQRERERERKREHAVLHFRCAWIWVCVQTSAYVKYKNNLVWVFF